MRKRVYKHVALFVIVMSVAFVSYSCGGGQETMEMGKTTVIEDFIEVTPLNVQVTKDVYPPVNENFAMGWQSTTEGKTFVAVIAKVENISDEDIAVEKFCNTKLTSNETTFDQSQPVVLSANETIFSRNGTISKGKTETVYFLIESEKTALSKEALVEFGFLQDGKSVSSDPYGYKMTVDATKAILNAKPLEMKEKIEVSGISDIIPQKVGFKKKIAPVNPTGIYHYYKAESTNDRLLTVTMKFKNLQSIAAPTGRAFGLFAVCDGKEYYGAVVANDENNANVTANESVNGGDSRTVYGIVNLDKAAMNKKCDIYLYIGGAYYLYSYNK